MDGAERWERSERHGHPMALGQPDPVEMRRQCRSQAPVPQPTSPTAASAREQSSSQNLSTPDATGTAAGLPAQQAVSAPTLFVKQPVAEEQSGSKQLQTASMVSVPELGIRQESPGLTESWPRSAQVDLTQMQAAPRLQMSQDSPPTRGPSVSSSPTEPTTPALDQSASDPQVSPSSGDQLQSAGSSSLTTTFADANVLTTSASPSPAGEVAQGPPALNSGARNDLMASPGANQPALTEVSGLREKFAGGELSFKSSPSQSEYAPAAQRPTGVGIPLAVDALNNGRRKRPRGRSCDSGFPNLGRFDERAPERKVGTSVRRPPRQRVNRGEWAD